MVCHNTGVNSALKLVDFISWEPVIKSGIEKLYDIAITGNQNMSAKRGCTIRSDEEIQAAVDYMVEMSSYPSVENQ